MLEMKMRSKVRKTDDQAVIEIENGEVLGRSCATQLLGLWCIEADFFSKALTTLQQVGIAQAIAMNASATEGGKSAASGGRASKSGKIAMLDISGPLTKNENSMMSLFGGTSTASVRQVMMKLAAQQDIGAIVMRIDSPGGSVAGTGDLADTIAEVNKVKPVIAFIEDLGASGAYWIASQAGHVHASRNANIGSIGTFAVVEDWSAHFEQHGVKAHVVKAGKHKGDFAPGTKVTDEQIDELQNHIDEVNDLFLESVAAGRGLSMDATRKLNDGRVHTARKAKGLGLIDEISTFEDTLRFAASLITDEGDEVAGSAEGATPRLNNELSVSGEQKAGTPPDSETTRMDDDKTPVGSQEGADPKGGADPSAEPAAGSPANRVEPKQDGGKSDLSRAELELMVSERDKRLEALEQRFKDQDEASTKAEAKRVSDKRDEIAARWEVDDDTLAQFSTVAQLETYEKALSAAPVGNLPRATSKAMTAAGKPIPNAYVEAGILPGGDAE